MQIVYCQKYFQILWKKGEERLFGMSCFNHDNAAPHKSAVIMEYLRKEQIKLLPHPPYSPDLAPCGFFLFPRIKKELKGESFNNVENLSRAVQTVVESIPKADYEKSFPSRRSEERRVGKECIYR